MRPVKEMGSAKWILFLSAVIVGIIIAASMGNSDPIASTVDLFGSHPSAALSVFFLGLGFMARGIDRTMNGIKRYFASILINFSIALFIFTLLYTILFVTTKSVKIGEKGEVVDGIIVEKIRLDLPDEVLVIGEEADVRIRNPVAVLESKKERDTIRSFPFSRFSGMYGYINDAGISPHCEINTQGIVTKTSLVSILPPGKKATQIIPAVGKVVTQLAPERTFQKGRLDAKLFDLTAPSFHIKIENWQNKVLFDGIVHGNSEIKDNNVLMSCGKSLYWVEILMQKSASCVIIYLCLIGIFSGLMLLPAELLIRRR